MSEVATGVHAIPLGPAPAEGETPPPQVYLVEGRDGNALIDAGYSDERAQALHEALRERTTSSPIKWILLTDWFDEHTDGAGALKIATGARVAAGQGDVDRINQAAEQQIVDTALQGEEVFDLGDRRIVVVPTPGHTPGSTCYLIEEEGILFSGDCILATGTTAVRPDEGGDMAAFVASLNKLASLDLKLILSFHGPPITDPKSRIEELLRHRAERDTQVLAALKEGAEDIDAIRDRLYADANLPERRWQAAREQVVAHLIKLEKEGRVEAIEPGHRYRPV